MALALQTVIAVEDNSIQNEEDAARASVVSESSPAGDGRDCGANIVETTAGPSRTSKALMGSVAIVIAIWSTAVYGSLGWNMMTGNWSEWVDGPAYILAIAPLLALCPIYAKRIWSGEVLDRSSTLGAAEGCLASSIVMSMAWFIATQHKKEVFFAGITVYPAIIIAMVLLWAASKWYRRAGEWGMTEIITTGVVSDDIESPSN